MDTWRKGGDVKGREHSEMGYLQPFSFCFNQSGDTVFGQINLVNGNPETLRNPGRGPLLIDQKVENLIFLRIQIASDIFDSGIKDGILPFDFPKFIKILTLFINDRLNDAGFPQSNRGEVGLPHFRGDEIGHKFANGTC